MSKTCNRCGYEQIPEAFPLHLIRGKRRRSVWCRECWRERSAQQRAQAVAP